MNRRRFLTVTAGLVTLSVTGARANTGGLRQWRGVALGAGATIALAHPDADRLIDAARTEIARLENVFSLYRHDSAISRLNRKGLLPAPPFEMLECLALCSRVHAASDGRFDPTIQPLWATQAEAWAQGHPPTLAALRQAAALVGWDGIFFDEDEVRLARPGMALTLNGVAQGYIADRVADLLRTEGLTDVLVDTGEIAARGHMPDGADWPVKVAGGPHLRLSDRAMATSAPLGTVFDPASRVGHILNPQDGTSALPGWTSVTITAPHAALADALSTAACLMPDRTAIRQMMAAFPQAQIEAIIG